VLNTVLLFFVPTLAWAWLGQLALKALTDYVLLREMYRFFGRRDLGDFKYPRAFARFVFARPSEHVTGEIISGRNLFG
ncbi:MAG: hypothetical protein ABL958_21450, partial [Bdellovibrionia bacterium]